MATNVVNVRTSNEFIYVGRYMPGRFEGHQLGNPYKLRKGATDDERRECLEKYRAWLLQRPDFHAEIDHLAARVKRTGLPLGCWCAPKACHADILAELVDARLAEIEGFEAD